MCSRESSRPRRAETSTGRWRSLRMIQTCSCWEPAWTRRARGTLRSANNRSVIFASRIAGEASGGEILVSGLLRELTEGAGDIRFDAGRDVVLKGFAGTHQVYPVRLA